MSASLRFQMYYFYRKSNQGHALVHCTEEVCLSKSLLLEAILYNCSLGMPVM